MIKKVCAGCGKDFLAENNRRRFCSVPCVHDSRRKKEKKCLMCGRDLLGLRNRSAICVACKRGKLQTIVISIKEERGCVDCGIKDYRVLDFDHVRGVKGNNVATMVHAVATLEAILKEIEKCEVRCSNCHRIQTFIRRNHDKKDQPVF